MESLIFLHLYIPVYSVCLPLYLCTCLCFFYATVKAKELTEMAKGKHHIGDFLPPQELEKFVETVKAVKEDRPPGKNIERECKILKSLYTF